MFFGKSPKKLSNISSTSNSSNSDCSNSDSSTSDPCNSDSSNSDSSYNDSSNSDSSNSESSAPHPLHSNGDPNSRDLGTAEYAEEAPPFTPGVLRTLSVRQ